MDAQYSQWVSRWQAALDACKRKGGEGERSIVGPIAAEKQIREVENKLGFALPSSFRQVLTEFSAQAEAKWHLPEGVQLPVTDWEIYGGECSWNLFALADYEVIRSGFEKDHSSASYDADGWLGSIWKNKLFSAKL